MKPHVPQLAGRRRLLASAMTVPAVLASLLISGVEIWRLMEPQSTLFAAPFAYSLAEAIERNDVDQAYGFIRAGHDPNQAIAVRHELLTGGRSMLVSPVIWAVATQSRETLLMLIGFGARVTGGAGGNAACLADALGNADMVRLLVTHGSQPPDERCRLRPENAPLIAFPDESGSARADFR